MKDPSFQLELSLLDNQSYKLTLDLILLWGSHLPCLEDTQVAALWIDPREEKLRLPANSQ